MNRKLAVTELKAVYAVLSEDIEEIRSYGQMNPTDFAHRTIVRTHFAFIEGVVYQLRQVALYSVTEHLEFFSPAEIAVLKEEKYTLNEKGNIKVQETFKSYYLRSYSLFSVTAKFMGQSLNPI